jgi:hypothetical protein
MEKFEESVLDYICGRPERFVNAHCEIPYDGFRGGSCPDFVVIDFADRTIFVVEVTVASAVKRLVGRVRERETRWLTPLREHFGGLATIFGKPSWEFHVTIFVRSEQLEPARQMFADDRDVSVLSLDETVFSWRWNWGAGIPANPLRAPGKERRAS